MLALLAPLVSAIAPKLAKKGFDILSGLFSSAAQKGVNLAEGVVKEQIEKVSKKIEEKTGITLNDIADDKLTEEQWRQLKEFELQEQEMLIEARTQLAAIELERENTYLEDLQDARTAGITRDENEDEYIRRFTYKYAYLITFLTFGFIILAVFAPSLLKFYKAEIPEESWQIINTVVGFLLGVGLSAIIQYFYGSSMGSKHKDRLTKEQPGQGGSKA